MTIIRHRQFTIRQYRPSDVAELVKCYGHSSVIKGTRGRPYNYRQSDAKKYIREKLRQYRRRKPHIKNKEIETLGYAIAISGQLAGGVGVTLDGHKAEIGYWLARPWWGQGVMTAVVRTWTKYILKKFKLKRVEAKVFPFNLASVRVLQKNRFHFEGRLIKNRRVDNTYLDHMLFAKTR